MDRATKNAAKTIAVLSEAYLQASSAELVNLLGFLAPDDIPLSLLKEGAGELPSSLASALGDALGFDEALGALRRYSLLELSPGACSCHRLVQAIVRDRLSEEEKTTWATAALQMVNAGFPFVDDDVSTWAPSAACSPMPWRSPPMPRASTRSPTGRVAC